MDTTRHMHAAIAAALHGREADRNPRVGCVLVDEADEVVSIGWHRGWGTPHAEVDALIRAGAGARGTTAFVTLEPCHHHGRTGPCTEALVEAGINRVVYAVPDPNPTAAGGAAWLRERGIEVVSGVLADEARKLNSSWLHRMQTGRPWVVWKFAATLDGRSAAADRTSQWITGPAARADAMRERARCGAVVVGTGTVLADDPRLTVRDQAGALTSQQPLRVVVGHRDLPSGARVLDPSAPTRQLRTHDLDDVLTSLADDGIHRLWLEGGPTLAASFVASGLVDEVIGYLSPSLLGSGTPAIGDLPIATIADIKRLDLVDVTTVGHDIRIRARFASSVPAKET